MNGKLIFNSESKFGGFRYISYLCGRLLTYNIIDYEDFVFNDYDVYDDSCNSGLFIMWEWRR